MSQTLAYLIHTVPYSDSRSIFRFFTSEFGRVSVLARRSLSSRKQSPYQPFRRYEIAFSGKNELKALNSCEEVAPPLSLHGKRLFSAMYINELIDRLVVEDGFSERLFAAFELCLHKLSQLNEDSLQKLEPILRCFELSLLEESGFFIDFNLTAEGDEVLLEEKYYYIDESGFSLFNGIENHKPQMLLGKSYLYTGKELQAIGQRDFSDQDIRISAKRLLRRALASVVGDKPIKSRELFY